MVSGDPFPPTPFCDSTPALLGKLCCQVAMLCVSVEISRSGCTFQSDTITSPEGYKAKGRCGVTSKPLTSQPYASEKVLEHKIVEGDLSDCSEAMAMVICVTSLRHLCPHC